MERWMVVLLISVCTVLFAVCQLAIALANKKITLPFGERDTVPCPICHGDKYRPNEMTQVVERCHHCSGNGVVYGKVRT